jgi:hypothetical protein
MVYLDGDIVIFENETIIALVLVGIPIPDTKNACS